ncbi:hypothetical protein FQA39_LY10274 [Lamprigera yunnana]|nr:hypothetical protein FQA39_LY10274 [Lamprigera yunnana]
MSSVDVPAGDTRHTPSDLPQIHREKDSVDDFEHLGLDSPLQEGTKEGAIEVTSAARDELEKIDTVSELAGKVPHSNFAEDVRTMDSNLLDISEPQFKEDDKMDKFLSELTHAPSVPSHDVSPFDNEKKVIMDAVKTATQDFMDFEKGDLFSTQLRSNNDDVQSYSYNDPEPPAREEPENDVDELDTQFREVKEPEIPFVVTKTLEAEPPKEVSRPHFEPVPEIAPAPKASPLVEAPKEKIAPPAEKAETPEVKAIPGLTDVEAIFKNMGLDAWFRPERLDPKVESLIYWRDPKKSGPVFGGVLVVLLALTYLSLISVIAYVSLLGLTATITFRIYKNVVHAVQKTGDGHPFKDFLETDLSLPQDKVKEIVEIAIAHINAGVVELRRLFLVEDLIDSIKFGFLLWCLTYVGAWFNGMTIIIMAWVHLFTLPKLYETNKAQIDANLDLMRSKLEEITSKVKAAIPIGKKAEEKKEQ